MSEGLPIDFHCRHRRWSSRRHLASGFSEHRLLLLNKVSCGILKRERDMHSVPQAHVAENTKPPPPPASTPQVHQGLCEDPDVIWKPQVGDCCAFLARSHYGHLWRCCAHIYEFVSGVCCPLFSSTSRTSIVSPLLWSDLPVLCLDPSACSWSMVTLTRSGCTLQTTLPPASGLRACYKTPRQDNT